MTIKKALPKDLKKLLIAVPGDMDEMTIGELRAIHDELDEFMSDQSDARSEKSDRWQEGDAGQAHQSFLDQCETLRDALSSALDEVEGIDFSMPECE